MPFLIMIVLFCLLTIFCIVIATLCTKYALRKRACCCDLIELTKVERVLTSDEIAFPSAQTNCGGEPTETTSLTVSNVCSSLNRSDQMWFVDLETPKECYRKKFLPFVEASPTSRLADYQCTYKKFPSPISNRTVPDKMDFSPNIVYFGESETLV